MASFTQKLKQLHNDLTLQGDRVLDILLRAVDCYFDRDVEKAREVVAADDYIDKVDVEIERASIPLLMMGETDEHQIRFVLTIVKVNNELERIADGAVNIAQVVCAYSEQMVEDVPATFKVMANSVVGMLRDTNRALKDLNVDLAQQVLGFDDTVDQFKKEIGIITEKRVASGEISVNFAFRIRTVTAQLERIADHCTNVCEQVIYLESGKIVRHLAGGWTQPSDPKR